MLLVVSFFKKLLKNFSTSKKSKLKSPRKIFALLLVNKLLRYVIRILPHTVGPQVASIFTLKHDNKVILLNRRKHHIIGNHVIEIHVRRGTTVVQLSKVYVL